MSQVCVNASGRRVISQALFKQPFLPLVLRTFPPPRGGDVGTERDEQLRDTSAWSADRGYRSWGEGEKERLWDFVTMRLCDFETMRRMIFVWPLSVGMRGGKLVWRIEIKREGKMTEWLWDDEKWVSELWVVRVKVIGLLGYLVIPPSSPIGEYGGHSKLSDWKT